MQYSHQPASHLACTHFCTIVASLCNRVGAAMMPENIEYYVSNVRNKKLLYLCSQSAEFATYNQEQGVCPVILRCCHFPNPCGIGMLAVKRVNIAVVSCSMNEAIRRHAVIHVFSNLYNLPISPTNKAPATQRDHHLAGCPLRKYAESGETVSEQIWAINTRRCIFYRKGSRYCSDGCSYVRIKADSHCYCCGRNYHEKTFTADWALKREIYSMARTIGPPI